MQKFWKRSLAAILICHFLVTVHSPLVSAKYMMKDMWEMNDVDGRILLLHVTGTEAEGNIPIDGATFLLFHIADVADMNHYRNRFPTCEELTRFRNSENRVAVLRTDQNGYALYNFEAHGLPDGVYLVVEEPNDAIFQGSVPFYLIIPDCSQSVITMSLINVPLD